MATVDNTQTVEDFDWEKPLGEETEPQATDTPGTETPGTETESEPLESAPKPQMDRPANLELLLDVPLEITAELGRTRMIINDLLQLGQGSVIELNKLAGEPLEILVNQKLIARGEVVVVNEKFGIRLTDILSPLERIKQLG